MRLAFRIAAALIAALFAAAAPAKDYRGGDAIALTGGNGLLALDVEALGFVTSVKIDRVGSVFGGETLTRLNWGTNIRLVELPAGEYRWSRVNMTTSRFYLRVRDDPRFHFRVEAGAINYAGDFLVAPGSIGGRYNLSVTNRAARMLVHLDRTYPGVRARYPMRYQGAFPDRFLQFAAEQLGTMSASDALKAGSGGAIAAGAGDAPAELRTLVDELFAPPQVRAVRLSPGGDLVAMSEFRGGKHRVSVLDAQSGVAVDVYRGEARVRSIRFADDETLLFEVEVPSGDNNYVVHVQRRAGAAPGFSQYAIPGHGWFVDAADASGHAIYARVSSDGALHMFRIALGGRQFDAGQFRADLRLDKGLDQAFFGLADGNGVLRLALTNADGDYALMYREPGGEWRQVRRYAADEQFEPVALSGDGTSLVALTNQDRAQTDLVRIALPAGTITETIYSRPGSDLDGVLMRDSDRQVIGVFTYRDGTPETHYLDEPDDALRQAVARALPGRSIAIYDIDRERKRMLVLASDPMNPGTFYRFDSASGVVQELLSIKPPMPHVHAVPSRLLRVVARDGTAIESYLTLPVGAPEPYPLIVMPHGGPIGVRDALQFDPEVLLLAHRGYAVLRVNYRGSGGFGRAFEQAGLGAWGRDIEDDILAATDAALKAAPIDAARVALRGASYGGYSTLMGLIRSPDRFRCGVAASAVTDVPLLFTSSDWSQDKRNRARMLQIVGDPATQLAEMESVSPDYLYRKLDRPLLVIHGALDVRVPLEHALRLVMLLGASGHAPQSLFFAHEGHGIADPAARFQAEAAADRFFATCDAPLPHDADNVH